MRRRVVAWVEDFVLYLGRVVGAYKRVPFGVGVFAAGLGFYNELRPSKYPRLLPVWLWVAVALVSLLMATFAVWRDTERARAGLDRALNEKGSREAVAERLDTFAHEIDLILKEPIHVQSSSFQNVAERIRSELRLHADGFLDYWASEPPDGRTQVLSGSWASWSIEQLHHIAHRLRDGHDTP
jgi:hypothetical protein